MRTSPLLFYNLKIPVIPNEVPIHRDGMRNPLHVKPILLKFHLPDTFNKPGTRRRKQNLSMKPVA